MLHNEMSMHENKKIVLLGDFNLPGVDWQGLVASSAHNKHVSIMFDIMLRYNLIQVVREPTRVQNTTSSVLDLAFISRNFSDYTVKVEPGLSDHHLVNILPLQPLQKYKHVSAHSFKDFSRANDPSIIDYMQTCLIDFDDNNVQLLWNKFKDMCYYCLDNFVPMN